MASPGTAYSDSGVCLSTLLTVALVLTLLTVLVAIDSDAGGRWD